MYDNYTGKRLSPHTFKDEKQLREDIETFVEELNKDNLIKILDFIDKL